MDGDGPGPMLRCWIPTGRSVHMTVRYRIELPSLPSVVITPAWRRQ
jgi:hypothetical protein